MLAQVRKVPKGWFRKVLKVSKESGEGLEGSGEFRCGLLPCNLAMCDCSRERLRRVPFKNLLWYSSANHHHLIIIIFSSSSHHDHLLIIISPSSSSSFPSLPLAFLFFSNLAQPSSHEKRARCNPSQEKCVSSVKNCGVFAIFWFLEQPSAGIRLSSVKNWFFFASFGVPGAPFSGKTRVECQKLGFFCVFGVPKSVLGIVLTIRFALYGRVFNPFPRWKKVVAD